MKNNDATTRSQSLKESTAQPHDHLTTATVHATKLPGTDVPYRIVLYNEPKASRKRKRHSAPTPKPPGCLHQKSGIDPRLSVYYKIEVKQGEAANIRPWTKMKTKQAFKNEGDVFNVGDVVLVSNSDSEDHFQPQVDDDDEYWDRFWVAQILEIRYSDSIHVYCRVWWLYRPEEAEADGRQRWHGSGEVYASNHMEIIDAMTIECTTSLTKIDETNVGEDSNFAAGYTNLVWRYALDVLNKGKRGTHVLDRPRIVCKCRQPFYPDFGPIRCNGTAGCGAWMHDYCIEDDIARRIYRREFSGEVNASQSSKSGLLTNIASTLKNSFNAAHATGSTPDQVHLTKNSEQDEPGEEDQELMKKAVERYDAELIRAATGAKSDQPLRATVSMKRNGKVLEEVIVQCLFCRQSISAQLKHALLKPVEDGDDEEDGHANGIV